MKIIIKILGCILAINVLLSCSKNNGDNEDLQKLYGSTIVIPKSATIYDSVHEPNLTTKCKIIVYYNSNGCTDCKLQELSHWKIRLRDIEELSKKDSLNVSFVFVFNPGMAIDKLNRSLNIHKLKTIVLIDTEGEFETNNSLPKNELYHTFLLDSTNKVVLIGTPTNNDKLWELYKSKIKALTLKQ